jgi:hypothetical protein
MEDLFLRPNEAHHLIELGFDWECLAEYMSHTVRGEEIIELVLPYEETEGVRLIHFSMAPTYQQAFKWFRKIHNTDSEISKVAEGYTWHTFKNNEERIASSIRLFGDDRLKYTRPTYEEAELACIEELISKHIQT